jgi:Transposase DNA-binding
MDIQWATNEMAQAKIGDERSRKNLIKLCATLALQPGIAFSRACREGGRKAAHRLFRQPNSTPLSLLRGHILQTAVRCQELAAPLVLAASDSTSMDYSTHKATSGLGPITTCAKTRGFHTHSVMALTPEGLPLGLLHQEHWVRPTPEETLSPKPDKCQRAKDHQQSKKRAFADKESFKWLSALQAVERALPPEQKVLLIQDREADIFEFIQAPRRANTHLLIRAAQPRRISVLPEVTTQPEEGQSVDLASFEANLLDRKHVHPTLFDVLAKSPVLRVDTLEVGRRADQPARQALMSIKSIAVRMVPPARQGRLYSVNQCPLVWLLESQEVIETVFTSSVGSPNPNEDFSNFIPKENGLHWVLLCTIPILDIDEASIIIQYYARRWQIERFHFVLKSGCEVEKLQMDCVSSLQKALSVYSVVAWWLLYLTHLARIAPSTPAESVMDPSLLAVVSAGERRVVTSVSALVLAIARQGGFRRLPSAPHPGVKSLWLGLRCLYDRYLGWQLAIESLKNAGQD